MVPCYNEEATIRIFYEAVERIKDRIPAEIEYCFVDDGSFDRTLSILRELENKNSGGVVHYISFSRNFGKEAALYAGLKLASGDIVVTMDVDLQDPPDLLPQMWDILHTPEKEYDCVATRRTTRKGGSRQSALFLRVFSINSSMNFRIRKSWMAPATIG